jgi:hypothetical protein
VERGIRIPQRKRRSGRKDLATIAPEQRQPTDTEGYNTPAYHPSFLYRKVQQLFWSKRLAIDSPASSPTLVIDRGMAYDENMTELIKRKLACVY